MASDNLALARACYQAYVDKDRDAIERLIAPDFHFTSPLDNRLDRRAYFERCWPNSRHASGFDYVREAEVGPDQVMVTYVGRTDSGHRFRNTEVLTLRDGQIAEVEVYFGWSLPHEAPEGGFVTKAAETA